MKRWLGLVAILIVSVGGFAVSSPSQAAATAAQDDPERGHQLFVQIGCYQCHGFIGQGGVGPRLAPNPMPFSAFSNTVYEPRDLMPRYPPQFVSEQDLRDLYAYLETIPPSPSADEIPLLRDLVRTGTD